MTSTKASFLAEETQKENSFTPQRAPQRDRWRSAPELDDLKEVIGTRAQVLAAIKLQVRGPNLLCRARGPHAFLSARQAWLT